MVAVSIASAYRWSAGGVFPALLLAAGLLGSVLAGPNNPPRSGDGSHRHGTRTEGYLRGMDANHDGILDASELRADQKSSLEKISQRFGVPIQFPLSLAKFRETMDAYYARQDNSGPRPSGPGAGSPGAVGGFGACNIGAG